jgi:serine/threonine protein phosphatase PrpC
VRSPPFITVTLVAGCGGSPPPDQTVPALGARLSAIDRAITGHEFGQARHQLQRLVHTTISARENGKLDRFAIAHIGDSRAYLLRGGSLVGLPTDHTVVHTLVEAAPDRLCSTVRNRATAGCPHGCTERSACQGGV